MFNDIINDMIDRLTNAGVRHIYSAFDSLPVIGKGGSFYTVVGINGFTAGRPVYSQFAAYIPYTMRMEILLLRRKTVLSAAFTATSRRRYSAG